jgi:anti-sigma regulatory factor (Ser/Thr protein kinase)
MPDEDTCPSATATEVVVITGRHRLPGDVSSELMAVLATEPRILVCDLSGMAPAASVTHVFEPVAAYLNHWPGTVVVAVVPEERTRSLLRAAAIADRLLVHERAEPGIAAARRLVADTRRIELQLPPKLTAPREARAFTTRALLDWQRPRLIATTTLVVSELVTESLQHASTVVDLALTQAGTSVRVAVHDRGGGRPRPRHNGWEDESLTGRGMVLVERVTTCWGLFPERHTGKTVWALLDAA